MTTTTVHRAERPLIDVKGVSVSFGRTRALIDVDLTVPAGTVQGLLGPNGAGKTTLVRVLATLLRPDNGAVRVAGVDVLRDPYTARTLIGLAGQFAAVDESLTARENLIMVGRLYRLGSKLARQRADETLDRLGLVDTADRQVQTFSGGMRRKLDLGASLVGEPRVLLLDEPTTGLDPRTRLDVWNFIRELVDRGTTVLLTTQYLEEADELADHIVVIDRGRSIAGGTSDELKANLASDLLEIEVSTSDLERTVELLRGVGTGSPAIDRDLGRISIPVRDSVPDLTQAVLLLHGAGIIARDIGLRRPSLDDVFLALTGHAVADVPSVAAPGAA